MGIHCIHCLFIGMSCRMLCRESEFTNLPSMERQSQPKCLKKIAELYVKLLQGGSTVSPVSPKKSRLSSMISPVQGVFVSIKDCLPTIAASASPRSSSSSVSAPVAVTMTTSPGASGRRNNGGDMKRCGRRRSTKCLLVILEMGYTWLHPMSGYRRGDQYKRGDQTHGNHEGLSVTQNCGSNQSHENSEMTGITKNAG